MIVFHCLVPLFTGGLIYLFFRSAVFTYAPKVEVQQPWLKQFYFTLPDFCWSYSFAAALYLFSLYYHLCFIGTAMLIFIALIGAEVVQLYLPDQFTFDYFDLAAAVLAFVLCTFQMAKRAYENEF